MEQKPNSDRMDRWPNIAEWLEWWLERPRLAEESQTVLERYYHSYMRNFNSYIKKNYSLQTKEVQGLIAKHEDPEVLEIGCGCGTESMWFAILGASVLGIDLSEDRLSVARDRVRYLSKDLSINLDVNFIRKSLFDLNNKNTFDIVWMEQTLHHIEPRERVPEAIASLLRPGGYLVISESNGWNPLLQIQLLKKRGIKTIKQYEDLDGKIHQYGVERITTPLSLLGLFSRNGFNKIQKRYFRCLPNFSKVEKLVWIEHLIPGFVFPAFTHYNLTFQKI